MRSGTAAFAGEDGDPEHLQPGSDGDVAGAVGGVDRLVGGGDLVPRDAAEQRQARGSDVVGVVDAVLRTRPDDDDPEPEGQGGHEADEAVQRDHAHRAPADHVGRRDHLSGVNRARLQLGELGLQLADLRGDAVDLLLQEVLVGHVGLDVRPGHQARERPVLVVDLVLDPLAARAHDLLGPGLAVLEVGVGEALCPSYGVAVRASGVLDGQDLGVGRDGHVDSRQQSGCGDVVAETGPNGSRDRVGAHQLGLGLEVDQVVTAAPGIERVSGEGGDQDGGPCRVVLSAPETGRSAEHGPEGGKHQDQDCAVAQSGLERASARAGLRFVGHLSLSSPRSICA